MEKILIFITHILVYLTKFKNKSDNNNDDQTLKIVLIGYNGAKNTGADARVSEMVKQFQKLLKDRKHKISVLTLNIQILLHISTMQ